MKKPYLSFVSKRVNSIDCSKAFTSAGGSVFSITIPLAVVRQPFDETVEARVQVRSSQIIAGIVGLTVGKQRRIQHAEAGIRVSLRRQNSSRPMVNAAWVMREAPCRTRSGACL